MAEVDTHRFVIESAQFAKLERALSVALPAARSLGIDAGIFWLRGSIFAATPYASIGLFESDIEVKPKDCIAIAPTAVQKFLTVLRSESARFIRSIEVEPGCEDDLVYFVILFDEESEYKDSIIVSRYKSSWRPRMTPREHYELLIAHRPYFECEFSIEDLRTKLRGHEDYGYVVLEDFPNVISHVTVSRSLLLAFLEAAKDEDTTFRLEYYGDQRCVVCRAGDVIAILSVID